MGLLDGIVGSVLGSALRTGSSPKGDNPLAGVLDALGAGGEARGGRLVSAVLSIIQQHGGLPAILDRFRRNGMAPEADSWVSTGENLEITAEQVREALGSTALGDIAAQLGLSPAQSTSALAKLLPELVNQLTPEGEVPADHHDLISKALAILRR